MPDGVPPPVEPAGDPVPALPAPAGGPVDRARGVAAVLRRAPAARGEVKPGVVARLLHQIWRSLSEGVLVVEEGGTERRLLFLRGAPVAGHSTQPEESIVRWLTDAGRLDARGQESALAALDAGLAPGAALVLAGAVEPGEPMLATLRAWLKTLVAKAVGSKDGRWRFHAGADFAAEIEPAELLPLQAILEAARAAIPVRHFADALKAVTGAFPSRTAEFQPLVPAAALGAADLRLALALDGRTATGDWLDARKGELKDALSLLWFLALVGAVAFHETAAPADDHAGARPPSRKKTLPPERALALRQAALQILPGTYLHALGLDLATDSAEVERAYREVALRFDPDGFAEYDVGDLADLLAAVQDKLAAAHRVLVDPEKRRGYLAFLVLRHELAGARRPGIDLDAEIALARGLRALRTRRLADAALALREAAERAPREPEYAAMVAFATLFDPVLPPAARAAEARQRAREALALAPDHPRALAVLALAEARLGNGADARATALLGCRRHRGNELLKAVQARLEQAAPREAPR